MGQAEHSHYFALVLAPALSCTVHTPVHVGATPPHNVPLRADREKHRRITMVSIT